MKVDKTQFHQNREHLQKLVNSQRNEISARETEISNLQKFYDKRIDQETLANEDRLLDIQERNKSQLVEATANQEGKLNELKKNLQDTQQHLQKQRQNLSEQHLSQIQDMNEDHSLKARDTFDRARTEMQDINFNVNNQIKKVKLDTEQAIEQVEHKSRLEIDKASFDSGVKMSQAQNDQAKTMKDTAYRYKMQQRQNEDLHKNKVAEEQFKNQMEFKNRERIFKDRHTAMEKHYQELLLSEKKAFEQKYAAAVEQHQSVLKELSVKLEAQKNSSVQNFELKKELIEQKGDDPFYSLQTLDTQMREDKDHYYLDLPVAEHEKDNFVVTAHKRKVKVRFSRSSEERLEGNNDSVQQSRRSESLTKEFKVDKILDSKKIQTAYNDGILTYKIAKA